MKARILVILIAVALFAGCGESWIKKPENLLNKKEMIKVMVDMHIANGMFQHQNHHNPDKAKQLKSEDYYYSVLAKHNLADSVFEQSVLYYSNFPKDFEKIYAEVLDEVKKMQEEAKISEKEPIDLGKDIKQ